MALAGQIWIFSLENHICPDKYYTVTWPAAVRYLILFGKGELILGEA